jgi:hypothetical protein
MSVSRDARMRIVKQRLLCVQTFATVEDLRQALLDFQRTYHENRGIQLHGYQTPT